MTNIAANPAAARPLVVLIIGGGIGGLCLAQGLNKAGIAFQVFERDAAPDARLQGYRLNIEPIGAAALHACLPLKLWQRLIATAGDAGRGMGVFDEALRLLLREHAAAVLDPVEDTHALSRKNLRQLLLSGIEDHVSFNKGFIRYELLASGRIRAHFSDGSSADGDLLVAADGVNSRVRSQFLPNAKISLAGGLGIGGKLPLTDETAAWLPKGLLMGKSMILPKRDFLFTATYRQRVRTGDENSGQDDPDYLMWAFVTRKVGAAAGAKPTGAALCSLVLERVADWSQDLKRLIAETPTNTIECFEFRAAERVRPWTAGAVTLLGDAIHAMPPVGGLGGNAALADARSLCAALQKAASGAKTLKLALGGYEREMLERGFAMVDQSRLYLQLAIFPSRLVRAAARTFFRACGASPTLKRLVFGPDA